MNIKLFRKIAWLLLLIPLSVSATVPISKTIDDIKATGGSTLSVPSSGSNLISDSASQALTNKTISGGSNTLSQLPVATQIQQYIVTPYPNGSSTSFTLSPTPPASAGVQLFLDGMILRQGSGLDYTISGATVSFVTAPATGQKLYVIYSAY